MTNIESMNIAAKMAHDAADMIHEQLVHAGALEARALLDVLARMRGAADDLQCIAQDVAEDRAPLDMSEEAIKRRLVASLIARHA